MNLFILDYQLSFKLLMLYGKCILKSSNSLEIGKLSTWTKFLPFSFCTLNWPECDQENQKALRGSIGIFTYIQIISLEYPTKQISG